MSKRSYTVVLDPWPEGNGYTITVPVLPGCVTQGKTKKEALERAVEAIRCHIEGLEEVLEEQIRPTLAIVEV